MLYMSVDNISVIPCRVVEKSKPIGSHERFELHTYDMDCLNMVDSNRLKIQYLNCIHDKICLGSDGYIESLVDGPDIIFHHDNCPNKHLKNVYNKVGVWCREGVFIFLFIITNIYLFVMKSLLITD